MIWLILFFVVIIISAILAYRSLKSFQELPDNFYQYTTFLIPDKFKFDLDTFQKLHDLCLKLNCQFSLERVFKGREQALILYGPSQLKINLPELNLFEIEDYLTSPERIDLDDVYGFLLESKNNSKKKLIVSPNFLKLLSINPSQKLFIQFVLKPQRGENLNFQVTGRVLVVDKNPESRINLLKEIENDFKDSTGLNKQDNGSISSFFQSFKVRSLIPKELSENLLDAEEVYNLSGLV